MKEDNIIYDECLYISEESHGLFVLQHRQTQTDTDTDRDGETDRQTE